MIDIHTHILPGLDDGARDMEDSLSMAALALKSGVHTLVATSHANTGGFFKEYSIEEYLQRLEAFRKALDEVKLPLRVFSGMEIYMTREAELYHTELIEKICELDDDLMMQYLEGEEPSVDDLKAALRKGTCECKAVPVCCGTAYRNKGVQKLLDAIIEFMPAPTDIPAIKGVDEDGNEVERHSSDDEPFSALAFKIMTDPFVGKLAFFRVYSGTCKSGSYVLNATKNKKERVGRILQMHANKREELDIVYSGDIAAAVGFKSTTTGDTICDEQHPVILESMEFPEPVIDVDRT